MSDRPRLVILGKQGAGKGTQAARLAEHYELAHLSTGDLFREKAAQGTPFGRAAKPYLDAGELVPDDIVLGVVGESLEPGGPLHDGFVLDGFPRTLAQAEALDDLLGDRPLDLVLNLDVPHEIAIERMTARGREDDTAEAIERRLELYRLETEPIIDHYRRRGQLAVVDGVGDTDEIFDRLCKVVDTRRDP